MNGLPERLRRLATEAPGEPALAGPDGIISYDALETVVARLADALADTGATRVGLCGDNSAEWVMADLACRRAGIICVPVPEFFSPQQRAHLEASAGLEGFLHAGSGAGASASDARELGKGFRWQPLRPARPLPPLPAGTGKITFTSGSTGQPRGVCLSHSGMDRTVAALARRLGDTQTDRHLCVLPLATLLENLAGVYLPLWLGGCVHLWPLQSLGMAGSSGLRPEALVTALDRIRPQSLILVPELATCLADAVEQGALADNDFRFLAVGGGRVSPELIERGRRLGLPFFEGYGLSECGSVVTLNSPASDRPGSSGRALDHVRVMVTGSGEVQVVGNHHLGYLGDPPVSDPDRPLATGDLGRLDSDGYLFIQGRRKNLLITSYGRNISPEWLESELVQTLGVPQALVFGDGEPAPSALIVSPGKGKPEALARAVAALNSRLPDYARLAQVYVQPKPFSPAMGHVTGNGRLARPRLLADLPELLAMATRLPLTETPGGVSAAHTLAQQGNCHMSFFERLQAETAPDRAHIRQAPVLEAIAKSQFDLASYHYFLAQAYHHVKHTAPLMMACGSRLPERLEFVRKALVEYIDEEYGHHEWILNDLQACGGDPEEVRDGEPDLPITLMVSYLYDQINRGNPVGLFGMVQVLEGTSVDLATPMAEQIQQQLGLPREAFSYLFSHGALDLDHFAFFRNVIDQIQDPQDQADILATARVVYRLYGDMLHAIPLPQRQREVRHATA